MLMTQPAIARALRAGVDDAASGQVGGDELRRVLQQQLDAHLDCPQPIVALERRPSPLRSSFGLEELDVALEDGSKLALVCKDLSRHGMPSELRAVKPVFVYNPYRELEVYQSLLPGADLNTARCYGGVAQQPGAARERYWLFLERVSGQELYLVGDLAIWRQAALWLAALHAQSLRRPGLLERATHLLRYDRAYYGRWQERARAYLSQHPLQAAPAELNHLLEVYGRAVDLLLALPQVWIHGEFYASNVLVQTHEESVRICPVDWEMSAVGPGLIDLAALTAGNWQPEQRAVMVEGYYAALAEQGLSQPAPADFAVQLACCRLHGAIQWLGWSLTWSPPPEHAHDWLAEAQRLAAELDPLV